MGRHRLKRGGDRDGGAFIALPHSVVKSAAYVGLSHPARSLLLEIVLQYKGDNNGSLKASRTELEPRGWRSADVIQRAKRELIDAGFLHELVKGHRPNKASWFAVTWHALDRLAGYDTGADLLFRRSAYLLAERTSERPISRQKRDQERNKGKFVSPSNGTKQSSIVPSNGTDLSSQSPSDGAIKANFDPSSAPPNGHHLEVPSLGDYLKQKEVFQNKPARTREDSHPTPLGRLKSLRSGF